MSTLILTHSDLKEVGKEPTKENIPYDTDVYDTVLFTAGKETVILKSLTKEIN